MKLKILLIVLLAFVSYEGMAANPPIAKLTQPSGVVEYSVNGNTWRPAPRIKYLFEGYMVRTGNNSSAKLINQASGLAQILSKDSKIEIVASAVEIREGKISKPKEDSTSVWQSIQNKFALAQKYTTVRRNVRACDTKVRTADVTLSQSYPDLVWRNVCPEYYYRLIIDGSAFEVTPKASAEMIRYALPDLSAGEHSYKIEVLDADGTVFRPRTGSIIKMLSASEQKELDRSLAKNSDDIYQLTSTLQDKNLLVAAMDQWRQYFLDYPEENDLRPMLAEAYARLRLDNLRDREAQLYQSQVDQ